MRTLFITLALISIISIADAQEKKKRIPSPTKTSKKVITNKKTPQVKSISKIPATEIEDTSAPEKTQLEKAYAWLSPFKSYHLMSVESMETNLKNLDLATGSGIINGISRSIYMCDDSLIHLKAFKGLELIQVPPWMTNKGLDHIRELPNLTKLYLSKSKINDQGLDKISGMSLTNLILFETPITNNGLAQIVQNHSGLQILNIGKTSINDDGLTHLSNLHHLKTLILSRGNFTDNALPHLLQLTNLQFLSVEFTQISAAGKEQLKNAFPTATIID